MTDEVKLLVARARRKKAEAQHLFEKTLLIRDPEGKG